MTRTLALLALALLAGCSRADTPAAGGPVVLRFWAFGREGEVVREMVPEFERRNPGIRVDVQQVPWRAAHEKLLTAFVGRQTPDIVPIGNTWVPEFAAIGALEPLGARVAASPVFAPNDYFRGLWETNVIDGALYGVPWYADTRLLFYRTDLLREAGIDGPPRTWTEFRDALRRVKARAGQGQYAALLPLDEWSQPAIFGLQAGAAILRDEGRFGGFREPAFRRGAAFYLSLFEERLAPVASNAQVSNVYQQFERGEFAFYVTGPWNIGEFRARLSPAMRGRWSTAPLPAPDGEPYPGVSLAGGTSLVVFAASPHKDAAFRFLEYLSEPAQQVRLFELTGDLPARTAGWQAPGLAEDPQAEAFRVQLERVVPTPKVPEWENVAWQLADAMEAAARGKTTLDEALARLDADVDRTLAKRRWVLGERR